MRVPSHRLPLLALTACSAAVPAWAGSRDAEWTETGDSAPVDLPNLRLPSAVVGGELAVPSDADRVGALVVSVADEPGAAFCSATHVTQEILLTAAHCISATSEFLGDGLQVRVAFGTAPPYDEVYDLTEAYAHPEYDVDKGPGGGFDLGIVRLDAPRVSAQPLPLLSGAMDGTWIGATLRLGGYGVTGSDENDSGVLRWTDLDLIYFQGDLFYAFSGTLEGGWPAAWDAASNMCRGDSGGPAWIDAGDGPVLVGVNSIVAPGCEGGMTGATRLDDHLDWVVEEIAGVAVADVVMEAPVPPEPKVDPVDPEPVPDPVEPEIDPPSDSDGANTGKPPLFACSTGAGATSGLWGLLTLALMAFGVRRRTPLSPADLDPR